jgi:hypothetical protein
MVVYFYRQRQAMLDLLSMQPDLCYVRPLSVPWISSVNVQHCARYLGPRTFTRYGKPCKARHLPGAEMLQRGEAPGLFGVTINGPEPIQWAQFCCSIGRKVLPGTP